MRETSKEEPQALVPAPAKHGLYVRGRSGLQLRDRKVRRLVGKMRRTMSWLQPSDDPACRAWAELEILASHVFADLVRNGATNANGDPRRLLSEYRGLRGLQLAYEKELGMTPSALAQRRAALMDAKTDFFVRHLLDRGRNVATMPKPRRVVVA